MIVVCYRMQNTFAYTKIAIDCWRYRAKRNATTHDITYTEATLCPEQWWLLFIDVWNNTLVGELYLMYFACGNTPQSSVTTDVRIDL